jgi:pyruvate/2-oxoacid:ferredoxin oxidoreductase beta subunit
MSGTKSLWSEPNDYFQTGAEQCRGCGSLLAAKLVLRAIYEKTPDAMVFGRSCGGGRSELQTGGRIGVDGSGMMGIQAAMETKGVLQDRTLAVLTGEGRALEMGAGDFLASFDRQQALTWIILDNQAYANSGSAANAMTPSKASTRIYSRTSGGKPTAERDMPMMMMFSRARYVATATPAYVNDLVAKVQDAMLNQPSYLHVYVPCQVSWIYQPQFVARIARLMVQTGIAPLWSYKEGVFKRTVKVSENKRRPVAEYLELQRRFDGLTPEDMADLEYLITQKNKQVDALEQVFSEENAE